MDELNLLQSAGFWVTVSFVIVVGMLWKFLVPIMTRSLDQRTSQIKDELDHAMALREEAQVLLAKYQKKQRESLQAAEEIIQKANLEARRITKEAETDVETALKKRMKLAMDKIEQAERKALQDVQDHIIDITVAATRRIVEKNLTPDTRDTLIKLASQDIEKKLH